MKQIPKNYWKKSTNKYFKDGINNHIVHKKNTVNPKNSGTKAAFNMILK
jgi:hypothetical protein